MTVIGSYHKLFTFTEQFIIRIILLTKTIAYQGLFAVEQLPYLLMILTYD